MFVAGLNINPRNVELIRKITQKQELKDDGFYTWIDYDGWEIQFTSGRNWYVEKNKTSIEAISKLIASLNN